MKSFDAAIIGGGLIGSAIALELSSHGYRVVLCDRGQPGQEASWAAAGMLSPGPDDASALPLVPLAKESLRLYPDFVSLVESTSGCKTDFAREGAIEIFTGPRGEAARNRLLSEHRALGLPSEGISIDAARKMEPSLGGAAEAAAWLPYEATVDPRLLAAAAIEAARQSGVDIRPQTRVESLLREGGRCAGITTDRGDVHAECAILAAGCFSGKIADGSDRNVEGQEFSPVPAYPVRGQMIALRGNGIKLRRVLRSARGYIVPRADGRIVAGSTLEDAGFEKRVTPAGLRKILGAAEEILPAIADAEILEVWSGLRPATPDFLPVLGPSNLEGLLIATGHYRNGILLAPVTAKLMHEWISGGKTSLDAKAFSPQRFSKTSFSASHPKLQTTT